MEFLITGELTVNLPINVSEYDTINTENNFDVNASYIINMIPDAPPRKKKQRCSRKKLITLNIK